VLRQDPVRRGARRRRLHLGGEYYAIEDRCSHDDGPLAEGDSTVTKRSPSARATARTSTSARARTHAPGCRPGRDVPRPRRHRDDQGQDCLNRSDAGRPATRRITRITTRSGDGLSWTSAAARAALASRIQSGLSWLTILRKREAFRRRSRTSTPNRWPGSASGRSSASADAAIVRHRGKIEAAIANARVSGAARRQDTLDELVWRHRPKRSRAPRSLKDNAGEHAGVGRALQGG